MTNLKNAKLAIVGGYPPPFGGVSVHIKRILACIDKTDIDYVLFNTAPAAIDHPHIVNAGKASRLFQYIFLSKNQVLHFHTNHIPFLLFALSVLPILGKQVMITLHSERPMRWYNESGSFKRSLFRSCIKRSAHIICVSEVLSSWLQEIGVLESNITVSPAYLPPSQEERSEANLDSEINGFLRTHSPIIGSHGWFGYFVEGVHVYSFDMIIELIQRLRKKHENIGFYTFISGVYDSKHRDEIYQIRSKLHLEKDWLILEQQFPAASLYERSDVFVRPTITDGDSVSIRECLDMQVPVVASDAVKRAEGCVLFENRNLDEFEKGVCDVLDRLQEHKTRVKAIHFPDNAEKIINIYRKLTCS